MRKVTKREEQTKMSCLAQKWAFLSLFFSSRGVAFYSGGVGQFSLVLIIPHACSLKNKLNILR